MAQFGKDEIVIEVDHPKSADVDFFPANCSVRSKIYPSRLGSSPPPEYTQFHATGIPGQRIHLDPKARIGRIVDGLGDKENESIIDRLKAARTQLKARGRHVDDMSKPVREKRYENLSDEDIRTWMFWMRKLVDGKPNRRGENTNEPQLEGKVESWANQLQGKLPTLEDIVKEGPVRRPVHTDYGRRHPHVESREPVTTP